MNLTSAATLALLFALIGTPSYGQGAFGVTGGLNTSKIVASDCRADQEPCSLDSQAGFTGGVFVTIAPASPMYAIEPELLFATKGGKDTEGGKGRNNINYLEVPVLARVNVSVGNAKPFVVVGPSFGFRLSAKDSDGNDIKDDLKALDLEIVFGGGLEITNMIGVEARFQQSLADQLTDTGRRNFGVSNQPYNKFYNRAISILVDISLSK